MARKADINWGKCPKCGRPMQINPDAEIQQCANCAEKEASRSGLPLLPIAGACLVIGLVAFFGVGLLRHKRPKTVPVDGVVELEGQPVVGASVVFRPKAGGHPATGMTDTQGRFNLTTFEEGDGALRGTHQVVVIKIVVDKPSTTQSDMDNPEGLLGSVEGKSQNVLPEVYASPDTTDIEIEVTSGMDEVKIQLMSQ